jgi:hypothetical protein
MAERVDVEEALKSIRGGFLFSGAAEKVRELVSTDEKVLRAINSNASIASSGEKLKIKPGQFSNKKPGILVVTSKRIFHVAKALWQVQFEQIALDQIDSVEFKTGLMFASLRIYGRHNIMELDLGKKEAQEFAALINQAIADGKQAAVGAPSIAEDIPTKLRQLIDLKAQGIISEDEFAAKRKELLARM